MHVSKCVMTSFESVFCNVLVLWGIVAESLNIQKISQHYIARELDSLYD